jgi:hypothetical protein
VCPSSSGGQSSGFLNRLSGVRVAPGVPDFKAKTTSPFTELLGQFLICLTICLTFFIFLLSFLAVFSFDNPN